MVSHEKKHTVAFCISVIAFCGAISLIAAILITAVPLTAIIVSTIIGAITILPACQAIESYSVIKNSNKVTSGLHAIKETLTGEESELFIEKVFNHLCGFFSKEKESSTLTERQEAKLSFPKGKDPMKRSSPNGKLEQLSRTASKLGGLTHELPS